MAERKLRLQDIPSVSVKGAVHFIVISLFALVGGGILGAIAPAVLLYLYKLIGSAILKTEPAATGLSAIPMAVKVAPFALLGVILGGYTGIRFLRSLERIGLRWDKMEAGDKVTFFVGIFAGLIISVPVILMFQALDLPPVYRTILIGAVILGLGAVSVFALQSMAEILPWNRNRAPKRRSGIKLLDTNVIIDGRIYDVVRTGFIDGQMYVPGFVLDELHNGSDGGFVSGRSWWRDGLLGAVTGAMSGANDQDEVIVCCLALTGSAGIANRVIHELTRAERYVVLKSDVFAALASGTAGGGGIGLIAGTGVVSVGQGRRAPSRG